MTPTATLDRRGRKYTTARSDAMAKARERMAELRELQAGIAPYLNMLSSKGLGLGAPPRRGGDKRTPEQIGRRIVVLQHLIAEAKDPVHRVMLIQERLNLEDRGTQPEPEPVDIEALEAGFVKAAPRYSELKGISYQAWRTLGVPRKVLAAAGLKA